MRSGCDPGRGSAGCAGRARGVRRRLARLPERLRTRLGQASARLGVDAVVGIASFQRQHRCRLRLGPVDLMAYVALLPGGERLERLSALMRLLLGDPIEWDLALILDADEVPPLRLDGTRRLGWTTWLRAVPVIGPRTIWCCDRCAPRPEEGRRDAGDPPRRRLHQARSGPVPGAGKRLPARAHPRRRLCRAGALAEPDPDAAGFRPPPHRRCVRDRSRAPRRRHEPHAGADPQGRLGDARLLRACRPGHRARLDRGKPGVRGRPDPHRPSGAGPARRDRAYAAAGRHLGPVSQARRGTAGPRPAADRRRARPRARTARSRWRRPAPVRPASCRRRRWARPRHCSAIPRT